MKNNRVINMTDRPLPTAYSVPDAHPPPSCMPIPKINAPTSRLTPTGETNPETSLPKNEKPNANIGANKVTATERINICDRIELQLQIDINRRNADVNPKRA